MLFILSFIIPIGSFIFLLAYFLLTGTTWWLAILLGIGGFLAGLALIALIAILLLIFLGGALAKRYNPKGKFRNAFIRDIARISCFWLGVRFKVEGLEKIPHDRPLVFYTNHQSFLDMFFFFVILKDFPHASLYKDAHDRNPIIGGIARALGGMGIDRENDYKAAEVIVKVIKEVRSGVNFMIYPEGTRSHGQHMHPFRAGSFKVVQKSGADLVVFAHDGGYRIARRMPRITRVFIKVVDVIPNEVTKSMNTHELSDLVYQKIEGAIQEARQKYKFLFIPRHYIKKDLKKGVGLK